MQRSWRQPILIELSSICHEIINGVLEDESVAKSEESASHDFAMAGKYGSQLARAMSVRTNPYAKLCGAIVQTAMQAEMRPVVQ